MQTLLTILIVLACLAAPGSALAEADCTGPMADWQPRAAVLQMAEARGWTVRRVKIDDGCYEIDATDAEGRAIEVKVDPGTLEVIEVDDD